MAWQVLIEQKVLHLPVNMSQLCLNYESYPLTYDRASDILDRYGLLRNCKDNDGFALHMKERFFVFYNNKCTPGRIRFTLAHELGHILLGHLFYEENGLHYTLKNREPTPTDSPIEHQANIFASRLLAPACILDTLNIRYPDELMTLCGLSRQSAEFRLARMTVLRDRKKDGLRFHQHFLERQVLHQFRPFIRWARDREVHQSFQQFHIVRKDHVIGTTLGLVSTRFPDIIALPPDVLLQENALIHE